MKNATKYTKTDRTENGRETNRNLVCVRLYMVGTQGKQFKLNTKKKNSGQREWQGKGRRNARTM